MAAPYGWGSKPHRRCSSPARNCSTELLLPRNLTAMRPEPVRAAAPGAISTSRPEPQRSESVPDTSSPHVRHHLRKHDHESSCPVVPLGRADDLVPIGRAGLGDESPSTAEVQ